MSLRDAGISWNGEEALRNGLVTESMIPRIMDSVDWLPPTWGATDVIQLCRAGYAGNEWHHTGAGEETPFYDLSLIAELLCVDRTIVNTQIRDRIDTVTGTGHNHLIPMSRNAYAKAKKRYFQDRPYCMLQGYGKK